MIPVRDSNGNLKKGSEDLSFLILSEYMNGKRSGIVELGNNRYFWEQKKGCCDMGRHFHHVLLDESNESLW